MNVYGEDGKLIKEDNEKDNNEECEVCEIDDNEDIRDVLVRIYKEGIQVFFSDDEDIVVQLKRIADNLERVANNLAKIK